MHSRTQTDEGRRIRQIDGGWALINHGKYRALLSAEERREYNRKKQAEWRANNPKPVNDMSMTVNHNKQCQHISEAEAEADTEEKNPCRISSDVDSLSKAIWENYPPQGRARSSKKQVLASVKKTPVAERPSPEVAASALSAWCKSDAWTKENGQFVMGAHRWISDRQWENIPEPAKPTNGKKWEEPKEQIKLPKL
jgi:hypothetical protein